MSALLEGLARALPAVGVWTRRAWRRRQRQRLVGVTTTVVWIPGDEVPWAPRERITSSSTRTGRAR